MTGEIGVVAKFFDGLIKVFDLGLQEKGRRDKAYDDALKAIGDALVETKLYLAQCQEKNSENRKNEPSLARLWIQAALAIRRYDPMLAERCFSKSDYWTDPAKWDAIQVREAGIKIERIDEYFRQLAREHQ
jgi:hypothetical protein